MEWQARQGELFMTKGHKVHNNRVVWSVADTLSARAETLQPPRCCGNGNRDVNIDDPVVPYISSV